MQRLPVHKRWPVVLDPAVHCGHMQVVQVVVAWTIPACVKPVWGARNVMPMELGSGTAEQVARHTDAARPPAACTGDSETQTRTRRKNRPSGACNGKGKPGAMGRGHSRNIPVPSIQRSFEIVHRLGHLRLRDPPYPVSVESAATNSTERADLFYCCGALAKPLGLL
jgi:hypothetical protein